MSCIRKTDTIMGLLDFLKKGEEKPAPEVKKAEVKPSVAPSAPASPAKPVSQPAAEALAPEQTYTVQKGDTLSKIAKQYLGDANKWNLIFQANKNLISNPDLIKPGQILKIPKA